MCESLSPMIIQGGQLMAVANFFVLSAWVAVGLKPPDYAEHQAQLKATAVATKPLDRGWEGISRASWACGSRMMRRRIHPPARAGTVHDPIKFATGINRSPSFVGTTRCALRLYLRRGRTTSDKQDGGYNPAAKTGTPRLALHTHDAQAVFVCIHTFVCQRDEGEYGAGLRAECGDTSRNLWQW